MAFSRNGKADWGVACQEMIVHAAPVNVKDGHTPLHYAAYHGHESCVLVLIDDVEWKAEDENSFGPLHGAAYEGVFKGIVVRPDEVICRYQGHSGCLETLWGMNW